MTRYAKASRLRLVIGILTIVLAGAASADPAIVRLQVQDDGSVDLGGIHFTDETKLQAALKALANRQPRPEVHLRGDKNVSFEKLGRIILLMQKAGLAKRVGFTTEPPK
jgi:biopolymer transport protein ExbD